MMNAIAYLFEREEIPPEAIRNTMLYCLDCHSKEGIPGKRGTSRAAMMFLSNWLNEYGELGIMSVSSEYLSGRSVYISEEGRINHALNHGGVAVVRLYLDEEHYVLMTGVENGNILLFDPYYWDESYEQKDILIDKDHPRAYNRIVPFKYFNQEIKKSIPSVHWKSGKQSSSITKRPEPYRRKSSSTLSDRNIKRISIP